MMTEKQASFIKSLLSGREYDYTPIISAFKSGFDLSSKDASSLIEYLLSCPKKDADKYAILKSKMYRTVNNRKSKKNEETLKLAEKIVGKWLNKSSVFSLESEQYEAIAHLFQ